MKLSRLLIVGFASIAMAGCSLFGKKDSEVEYDLNPTINGGSKDEKTAILEALNNKPICMKNGTSSSEIFYDATPILMEDEGDSIKLTTKQVVNGLTVDISWGCDESQTYFGKWLSPETDLNHKFIEIKYKGYADENGNKNPDGSFTWKITKLQCGEAVADSPEVSYSATVKNEQYKHDNMTIAECYAFSPDKFSKTDTAGNTHNFPSTFNLVDYIKEDGKGKLSPYYKTNNPDAVEKQYYYVNVTGKCIFLAPDGNFGLIADGEEVMEIYAGSGTALKTSNWPNLKVGSVVTVVGNLGQYCGNVQLGFITKVLAAQESAISPVDMANLKYNALSAEVIASLTKEGFSSQTQALKVGGIDMMGSLRSVTGTVIANSIKYCEGDAATALNWKDTTASGVQKGKRFTFKLQVAEGVTYNVTYDYHAVRDSSSTLFADLQAKLSSTSPITIKGFSRYFGSNSEPFDQEVGGKGAWSIVPFLAEHVA